jgi:hypothetical protein
MQPKECFYANYKTDIFLLFEASGIPGRKSASACGPGFSGEDCGRTLGRDAGVSVGEEGFGLNKANTFLGFLKFL